MSDKETIAAPKEGKIAASPVLVKQRLSICDECPDKIVKFKIVDCCNRCGCPLISRTYFTKSFCPAQKW